MPNVHRRSARRLASYLFALAAVAICVPAIASAETAFRSGPGITEVDESCEVVHLSSDGNLATCTDASDDAGLGLLDVSNLADPVLVGRADFEVEGLEITSATFSADDRFILGCFVDPSSSPAGAVGRLVVWKHDGEGLTEVRRMPLPAQPDSIEVSPDGRYAAIAIEDETHALPGGLIEVLELVDPDDPQTWTMHEVPIVLDSSYSDNAEPQPEYVDFNQFNEIALSIQEQNAIGIIDAPAATDGDPGTDPVETIFSAGQTDFPDDKNLNDARFLWNPATPTQVDRQPDAVGWTADGQAIAAVAEGELTDPHEWDIYDRDGNVLYASGENMNRNAALFGQQPVNFRGSQPEGLTVATYHGREYVFLVTERTANVSVYDITDSRSEPELVGVYPTGTRPETVSFNSNRGLAIIGNETDHDPAISTLVDMGGDVDRDRPLLKGDEPWTNLRGLAGTSRSNEFLAVTGENPKKIRRITLTGPGEAAMSTVASVPAAIETQAIEDVVSDGDDGYWILSGSETIRHLGADGAELQSIPSPVSSPVGLALTASGDELVVIDAEGHAARVRIFDLSVTSFSVTTSVEGLFADLETAPDGSLVALRTNAIAVDDGLIAFPDDVAEGESFAGVTRRLIPPSARSVQDYATGLAITPAGDIWFAYGASLKGNNGTDHGLTRIRGVFTPEQPAEEDRGLPSSIPAFAPGGTFDDGYRIAGGEIYGVGTPGMATAAEGSSNGPGAAYISPQTGLLAAPPDIVTGPDGSFVEDSEPDGAGGFYLVGSFSTINGQPSAQLAHVLADGSLDPAFTPPTLNPSYLPPSGVVRIGGKLWVGGIFSEVNGVPAQGVAALNLDGSLDQSVTVPGSEMAFFQDAGGKIYTGGTYFEAPLGGQVRGYLGRIDPATATVDSFAPAPNNPVYDVVVDGATGNVIAGGDFTTIGGGSAKRLAILDPTTGDLVQALDANGTVYSLSLQGRKLWVGGSFTNLNGVPAHGLAAIDLDNPANVTTLPAGGEPDGEVKLVYALGDGSILVGGEFLNLLGKERVRLAVFDPGSMTLRNSFAPAASNLGENRNTHALQLGPDKVLLTGSFGALGTSGPARYLSRIDPGSGAIDPKFDPPSNFNPGPLTADASYLYDSSGIRLDRQTGEVDPGWSFRKNFAEDARVLVHDGALYMWGTGNIKTLNGVNRNGIGAISTATGETMPFNPNPQPTGDAFGAVHDLVVTPDGRMFISGSFTRLGGQPAGGIAEIDPQTGAKLDTFDGVELERVGEASNRRPMRLAYDPVGEDLYVSNVATVNGGPASRIVALDVSGASASRVPGFNPQVSNGEFSIEWLAGRLVVQGQGPVNGIALPQRTKAYALTPEGELDRGFLPTDSAFAVEESQVSGSMFSINHTVYLPAAPTNLTPPQVVPGAQEGVEATCEPGGWDAGPAFAYRWLLDGNAIVGAAEQAFTPDASEVGHALSCEVTATNQLGEASATSAPLTVDSGVPLATTPPQISGTPTAGQALTLSDGAWTNSPEGFAYRWLRDGAPIDGQAANSYTLTAEDSGHQIAAEVTATNAKGAGVASAASVHVVAVSENTAPPQIVGTAATGQTLTAQSDSWTESPSGFSYQWTRDGAAISGATQATYVPVIADEGRTLAVTVVATNIAGSSAPAASTGVTIAFPDAPVNEARPVISGPGVVGSTLTCSDGSWGGERIGLSRQWLRSGDPVAGVAGASYVLSEEDLGRSVSCVVTATNPGGETAAESAAVSPQPAPAPPVTIVQPPTLPPANPPAVKANPPAAKPKPARPNCRKGFRAKKVNGKFRCVSKGKGRR